MFKISVLFVLLVVLNLSGFGYKFKNPPNQKNGQGISENKSEQLLEFKKRAPNFTLQTTDGKTVKLSDFKKKIVIIDFWATWCGPCRRGIPDLIEIQDEFKNDVVVLGISVDRESKKDVLPFMKTYGINYPIFYYTEKVVEDFGGLEGIPKTFIIDQRGYVVDSHVGLFSKSVYVDAIKKLLK